MAKTKRDRLKRITARIVKKSMEICVLIEELQEAFSEHHPEYDEAFLAMLTNQVMQVSFIKAFAEKAWGYFPKELDRWLH